MSLRAPVQRSVQHRHTFLAEGFHRLGGNAAVHPQFEVVIGLHDASNRQRVTRQGGDEPIRQVGL